MPICSTKKIKKVRLCTGDKVHLLKIVSRSISAPTIGSVDPQTTFTTVLEPWGMFETLDLSGSSQRYWEGVNIEDRPTHKASIDYDDTIWPLDSDNNFIEYDDRRFRIVGSKDLNELKTTIEILCTERGVDTLNATKA